ncbi:F0F1 ATP synthase subunit delta [Spirosoma spitsbergense]|uniref:F0F1 ATP synthase subunit delta n=1 Tax=Spirosoma spitsbergense TaxID=431554 RepID=UPI0003663E38|nr:F0F1 ATP synthase subunit delta [Spirosoma spitsbergense]
MQINWFTVIAQLFNFILLVWLMKRFLYAPILAAIDEREKKIKAQLNDAKDQKAEAKKEQDEFSAKNADFDQHKKALMDAAIAETQTERQKLLDAARTDAETLRTKQARALEEMQASLQTDIAKKTQQAVFSITQKALVDLASVSLESQSVAVFIERLRHLKADEKQAFVDAFQADKKPVQIKSAFALSASQQTDVKAALTKLLGASADGAFTTDPALISGISLMANGYKLAWSVADYLTSLEKSISVPKSVAPKKESDTKKHAVN